MRSTRRTTNRANSELLSPTRVRSAAFRVSHVGSAGTSPQTPQCNRHARIGSGNAIEDVVEGNFRTFRIAVLATFNQTKDKPQVVAKVMEYLAYRECGHPAQTIQDHQEQPFTIQLQWSSTPEWLPSVTVNQQVNHITSSTDRADEIRNSPTDKRLG